MLFGPGLLVASHTVADTCVPILAAGNPISVYSILISVRSPLAFALANIILPLIERFKLFQKQTDPSKFN